MRYCLNVSHLERAAFLVGATLIGTAAYLIISGCQNAEKRSQSETGEQESPVEELAEDLKQAWAGYHNR